MIYDIVKTVIQRDGHKYEKGEKQMRLLTVRRVKNSASAIAVAKICIEDYENGTVLIEGVRCSVLGEISVGEEKSFSVSENESRVFFVSGKDNRAVREETYQIHAGEDQVFLVSNARATMSAGTLLKRLIIATVIVAALVATFILTSLPKDKSFEVNGMSIVLTDEFELADESLDPKIKNYEAVYSSSDVLVFVLREGIDPNNLFIKDLLSYSIMLAHANGVDTNALKKDGESFYFSYVYKDKATGKTYHYTTYVYGENGDYWTVQFATLKSDKSEYENKIKKWASSVNISK